MLTNYIINKKLRAIKWHGGDKGSKLLLKAQTSTHKVRAKDCEETERRCISCRRVIETIEYVSGMQFIRKAQRYAHGQSRGH